LNSCLKYFKIEDFLCPCCGEGSSIMDTFFLSLLDSARSLSHVPFVITSGYRCLKHNMEVGGVGESAHMKGMAADISAETSKARYAIINALIQTGFSRIGIGKNFIHCDMDQAKFDNLIWLYDNERRRIYGTGTD